MPTNHENSLIARDNPGKLRHVVTIEQRTPVRTDSLAAVDSWSTYKRIRAQVEPMGGAEHAGADSFQSQSQFTILARWLPGIDTSMRANFNGRVFDITNINNVKERNRWMLIQAVEGRSHGNA